MTDFKFCKSTHSSFDNRLLKQIGGEDPRSLHNVIEKNNYGTIFDNTVDQIDDRI